MTTPKKGAEPLVRYAAGSVRIELYDESTPYGYSNIYHVKLRVVGRIPDAEEPYERVLERMGVYDVDLDRVRQEMLRHFEESSLPYLLRPDFASRLADHCDRQRQKVIPFPGAL